MLFKLINIRITYPLSILVLLKYLSFPFTTLYNLSSIFFAKIPNPYKISFYLPECTESLFELTGIKFLIAIEVHALENLLEAAETDTTLLLDCELELQVQLSDLHVQTDTVECHIYILF